ncbi:MAG: hypothetical protein KDB22_24190 [Planctomycetales bacterium]|nr:hypothetical protein [Planctomycetales bacterium]
MRTHSLALLLLGFLFGGLQAEELCRIRVVDAENGWPVPLVELKTTNNVRFYSDNAGTIAFDLPELMGVTTWFSIEGHGYGVKSDGFGMRGIRLVPVPGETLVVRVDRQLPAKRLGRITGGGIFGEAQRFGEFADWKDQGILGCDSVQNAVHNGKLFWAWGDTTLPGYPLGLFHMTSGTTDIRACASFEPPIQLRYDYFRDELGKLRCVAEMPGEGPTWLSGYVSLPDAQGRWRLVGTYIKVRPPLSAYESGLCVWNDSTENFDRIGVLWKESDADSVPPLAPNGHPVFWTDENGDDWLLFGDPFPHFKCPATFEAWADRSTWRELEPQKMVLARDGSENIEPHRGSIAWNKFRGKWVSIFCQIAGSPSGLGELWYAESPSPLGPWGPAIKVVTHHNYSFYNPRLHPEFSPDGSPILLFEATYSASFANRAIPTPRHDYNQVLYRLDLDDPALAIEHRN